MTDTLNRDDIQFIADFVAYARGRGDVEYSFFDVGNCAVAQFLRDTGRCKNPSVGGNYWRDGDALHDFPPRFGEDAVVGVLRTFAAAADRAEKLLPANITDTQRLIEKLGVDMREKVTV